MSIEFRIYLIDFYDKANIEFIRDTIAFIGDRAKFNDRIKIKILFKCLKHIHYIYMHVYRKLIILHA